MEERSYQNSERDNFAQEMQYFDSKNGEYPSPGGRVSQFRGLGIYQNEEDLYGDELDGEEDKNDGLNALVPYNS